MHRLNWGAYIVQSVSTQAAPDPSATSPGRQTLRRVEIPEGVGLIMGQAFFVGLAYGLLYNVAYTLLVYEFGSAGLRIVYLLVGVAVPLVTILFNALEERLPLSSLSNGTIGAFAVAFFALYPLIRIPGARWVIFVMMVINTMGGLYCMMLRGAQAQELYDARTIKSQYPRITGGEIFAVVLAGIFIGPLSNLFGSLEALVLLGGASMLVALFFVRSIGQRYLKPHEHLEELSEDRHDHHAHGLPALRTILGKRYTLLVFSFQTITSAASLLVQYLVYSEARNFFPAQADLSQFIGLVKAGTTGLSFLFLMLVAGKLLVRFGMPLGVTGTPIGISLVLIASLIAGLIGDASGQGFFVLIVASQFVGYMLYSGFAKTSVQSAFQPLPAHEREAVHTFAQGVGIPLSYGITGVLLVAFAQMPGYTTTFAVYLTLGVSAVGAVVGWQLYREYGSTLRQSLSRRRMDAVDLSLEDASTLQVVERLLAADDPWQVRSALDLLESAGHHGYVDRLRGFLSHSNADVRRDAIERIERLKPSWGREALEELFAGETDEAVQADAVRAICALVDEPVSVVGNQLHADSTQLQSAAVSGLFLYGGINGILEAGNVFNRLVCSDNPADRISAAQILERVGIRNFYHPLKSLLHDEDEQVVRSALQATRAIAHPALLPDITPWIDPVTTRAEALAALIALGDAVEPLLASCLDGSTSLSSANIFRVIRASSRIPDKTIQKRLETSLEHEDPDIAEAVYEALAQRGYSASPATKPVIRRLVYRYSEETARIVMALWEASATAGIEPLVGSLNDSYKRHLETIFLLLSFLYDPDEVFGIRRRIIEGSIKERGLGLELLEVMLTGDIKKRILAIAEHPDDSPPATENCEELFGIPNVPIHERIREILEDHTKWPEPWLRICAHHAAWVLGLSDDKPEDTMLTTIERVLALKAADIFAGIPDNVLAHIASIGEDVDVSAKETFIRKGELGNCMYIIRDGRVAIHDEHTRFAELSDGEAVGEMAVLDPEPRSASATALEDTVLLKIEKDAFDSVMVDHPGIARGVISVLCRRLRNTISSAS